MCLGFFSEITIEIIKELLKKKKMIGGASGESGAREARVEKKRKAVKFYRFSFPRALFTRTPKRLF